MSFQFTESGAMFSGQSSEQLEFGRIAEMFRSQIVSQRSGVLISLANGVWRGVLNIIPIYKLNWDCLDNSDFAAIEREGVPSDHKF